MKDRPTFEFQRISILDPCGTIPCPRSRTYSMSSSTMCSRIMYLLGIKPKTHQQQKKKSSSHHTHCPVPSWPHRWRGALKLPPDKSYIICVIATEIWPQRQSLSTQSASQKPRETPVARVRQKNKQTNKQTFPTLL